MSAVGEAYDHLDGCGMDGDGMCPCGCMEPTCPDCGHCHTPDGCTGPPTPSDRWAGVSPSACDCDRWHSQHRWHCAINYTAERGSL